MEYITAFFASLMVFQTIVFLLIFRKTVMQLDITRLEELLSRLAEIESRIKEGSAERGDNTDSSLNDSAIAVLKMIGGGGGVTASDVKAQLQLSREHVARLLKNLYEMGLVSREGKPFRYSLTENAKKLLSKVAAESP